MFLKDRPDTTQAKDNIVRVQASRLRQRLETYFSEEGAGEELRLVIPKGTYVPRFESAPLQPLLANPDPLGFAEHANPAVLSESAAISNTSVTSRKANGSWLLYGLILCLLCPLLWEAAYLRYQGPGASISFLGLELIATPNSSDQLLWKQIFQRSKTTLIVPCDSGLVMYEAQSRKSINLAQYLSGEVQTVPVLNPSAAVDRPTNTSAYRYTSIVDLQVASKLMVLPEAMQGYTSIRYARDLKLGDLKGNNIVLIGAKEANPWVELFEQHMNFVFDDKRDNYEFVITNKTPQPGEMPAYKMEPNDPGHRAYALVALVPNLNRTGNVLIVEGSTMAGTEAAADFAFEGKRLVDVLRPFLRPNGAAPHFEILLQTSSIGGGAPESSVVAYRIHQD